MKAARILSFGSLAIEEVPEPSHQGGALVRVKAASVNPSDVKNVHGAMKQTTLPRTPGRDFAGVVEAGPPEWIGKEVWGTGGDVGFTRDGTHAELVAVPVSSLCLKPATLDFEQAATIGVSFLAAWLSVVDAAGLASGESIAVIGASGAVGGAAGQIAAYLGAKVYAIDRHEPLEDAPIRQVAHQLIIGAPDLAAALPERVDVVLDTVGGPMVAQALASLRLGGRVVVISASGGATATFDIADFYHNESRLIGVDTLKRDLTASSEILSHLKAPFEEGRFHPLPISARFPLDQAQQAYDQVAAGSRGRVVILP